ncbi:ATP-binding cassette domain-containing protein [Dehalococcoidia bacterium]|nr:ATP-binding cassette domain-containing protein [Dehalococcoidia bacterium]
MIKFSQVTKSFSGLMVLENLSFEVRRGEILSILGPSGIGKTTLLRLITGTLSPDDGTVEVVSSQIGYIFQEPRLLPWRTARENISLVLRVNGTGKKEADDMARGWIERLGLRGFEDYYPAQLSGGMAQRVSIARAFAIEPEILLMDEPFSNLDTKLKEALLTLLEDILKEYRTTVVHVTHDLLEAVRLADRLFEVLPGGALKELQLNEREAIVRDFVSARLKEAFRKDQDVHRGDSRSSRCSRSLMRPELVGAKGSV